MIAVDNGPSDQESCACGPKTGDLKVTMLAFGLTGQPGCTVLQQLQSQRRAASFSG